MTDRNAIDRGALDAEQSARFYSVVNAHVRLLGTGYARAVERVERDGGGCLEYIIGADSHE